MEIKKSKKAQIERHRGTWLLMGFIVVLALLFVAFEWTQRDIEFDMSMRVQEPVFTEELTPLTFPEIKPPPPPPSAPVIEILQIAPDDIELDEAYIPESEDTNEGVAVIYLAPIVEEEIIVIEEEIFEVVEVKPMFPGGDQALFAYLSKHIKYPSIPQELGVQGKVILQFVVDKDGSISHLSVVRSVDPHLDKEAIRVVQSMPKWSPGKQRGVPVRVKYTLPVTFRLQ